MTKKDYVIIAKCLNKFYQTIDYINSREEAGHKIYAIMKILENMFEEFSKDNPKFDALKFKKAVYKK